MSNQNCHHKPNLFQFATKELSQDAILCWLIKWAGWEECDSEEDRKLRSVGREFICALLSHCGKEISPIEIRSTEVFPQEGRVDVLARINGEIVLFIEDKTHTSHKLQSMNDAIDRVLDGKTKLGFVNKNSFYPIYLKTGNQSNADYREIREKLKMTIFKRCHLISSLKNYSGSDSILLAFIQHLQCLESRTNNYRNWTQPFEDGDSLSTQGFFLCLEDRLNEDGFKWMNWNYVPLGDFLGFWWTHKTEDKLYLQIEVRKSDDIRLCFKVSVSDEDDQQQLKFGWHNRVMKEGQKFAGVNEHIVEKPNIMRVGKESMTVAWWKRDWMVCGSGGLDIDKTVKNLRRASKLLKVANSKGPLEPFDRIGYD